MTKPIKSREGLTRCAGCRAHIRAAARASETECPFCGALLVGGAPRRALSGRGGLLAAALFAFGATACGGDAAEDDTTVEPGDDTAGGEGQGEGEGEGDDEAPPVDDGYADGESEGPAPVALYGISPE